MHNEFTTYLDAFVASADEGSFSAAARRIGVTPPAVSKSVARLETGLGVRLFQRSTRTLSLTEDGERLYRRIRLPWSEIADALQEMQQGAGKPAGMLKVAMAHAVGRDYFVPLLEAFMARYPDIVLDLHFDNRQVDLIAEGFDVAIGGGLTLREGLVARELAPVSVVLVAAPGYLARFGTPAEPADLARHRGLVRRSLASGRLVRWALRNAGGGETVADVRPLAILDDPEAIARAAVMGLGIAMLSLPHALPLLQSGALRRILPAWHADVNPISIYFSSRKQLPGKVRVFIDHVIAEAGARGYASMFSADRV